MSYTSFKNIAIGIAFSPTLEANVSEAARLSCMFGAKLSLIHVGQRSDEKIRTIDQYIGNCGQSQLSYEIIFNEGDPVEVILETVKEHKIDLLLLGALKQEKFVKFYLGSIARKLTRKATCSVLMMTNPSVIRKPCKHMVVNGLKDAHTEHTIETAFYVAHSLGSNQLTIVEEIEQEKVSIKIDDDQSLRKANLLKEKLKRQEELRVQGILNHIPSEEKKDIQVSTQPIFGQRGYSIGHYAQIVRADLLVMNAPKKSSFLDRFFPHDLEHILNELPTDVLIVR
ncbi:MULTISPECIES: universal stress protein [Nonlabens]|uniref:Nucleotide-binding universal stress UspA family protein n=1 Tax=Nonlabens xylanidelens TaxID=191564 RepID=A0A2S6IQH5_9FLAO|nr:universal stress protein [Nonlabens xylanidelens]PPK96497.1 nucleotide-binding universal stress UspA family protein [Nonlabens xylanidelens]PQJ18215.1 universal stress protein UspA [Nonlabens xylanidelens]